MRRYHPIDDTRADHLASKGARASHFATKANTGHRSALSPGDTAREITADLEDYFDTRGPQIRSWEIYKGQILSQWEGLDPLRIEESYGDHVRLTQYISEATGIQPKEVQLTLRRFGEAAFESP